MGPHVLAYVAMTWLRWRWRGLSGHIAAPLVVTWPHVTSPPPLCSTLIVVLGGWIGGLLNQNRDLAGKEIQSWNWFTIALPQRTIRYWNLSPKCHHQFYISCSLLIFVMPHQFCRTLAFLQKQNFWLLVLNIQRFGLIGQFFSSILFWTLFFTLLEDCCDCDVRTQQLPNRICNYIASSVGYICEICFLECPTSNLTQFQWSPTCCGLVGHIC